MPTILIVDDYADNRDLLTMMLQLNGYTVVTATNGREALAVAAATRPALVLMDLAMPVMDGWSATTAFKQDSTLASIPVVAVTGQGTREALERAMAVGCSGYLEKPVEYTMLLQMVARWVPPPAPAGR